jgi:hypothetical protein
VIGIYKITNLVNKKVYIGQSIDIEYRFNSYKRLHCEDQPKLYHSLNKYGIEAHSFEIITECNIEDLNRLERYYQDLYNVLDRDCGLNLKLTSYDDKSGYYSNESKEKISNTLKRKYQSGELMPPNKGKIFSEETRKKLSIASTGKKMSDDTKNKIRQKNKGENAYWFGKNHTNETKLKIKENHQSKKENYIHSMLGKKHNENTRLKMAKNNAMSKMVVDLETGFVYISAKEAWAHNQDYLKSTYRSFIKKLTGESKIKTKFQYI